MIFITDFASPILLRRSSSAKPTAQEREKIMFTQNDTRELNEDELEFVTGGAGGYAEWPPPPSTRASALSLSYADWPPPPGLSR